MKRSIALLAIGILVLSFAIWKRSHESESPGRFANRISKKSLELDRNSGKSANSPARPSTLGPSLDPSPSKSASAPVAAAADASKDPTQEIQSLRYFLHLLGAQVKSRQPLEDLIKKLRDIRQEPVVVHDRNPYTGQLTIVRTKNTLPGTRYFHAQIFSGGKDGPFVQHMSFEFRPSPSAFQDAIANVKSLYPSLGKPQSEKSDFIKWDVGQGYVLWIKKLAAEDLEENPFNAYTKEDEGTIRVAVELDPHGNDHAH